MFVYVYLFRKVLAILRQTTTKSVSLPTWIRCFPRPWGSSHLWCCSWHARRLKTPNLVNFTSRPALMFRFRFGKFITIPTCGPILTVSIPTGNRIHFNYYLRDFLTKIVQFVLTFHVKIRTGIEKEQTSHGMDSFRCRTALLSWCPICIAGS